MFSIAKNNPIILNSGGDINLLYEIILRVISCLNSAKKKPAKKENQFSIFWSQTRCSFTLTKRFHWLRVLEKKFQADPWSQFIVLIFINEYIFSIAPFNRAKNSASNDHRKAIRRKSKLKEFYHQQRLNAKIARIWSLWTALIFESPTIFQNERSLRAKMLQISKKRVEFYAESADGIFRQVDE